MIEIPLQKYCEVTGQSKQTIYNKINKGSIKSRKDENNRVLIQLDIDSSEFIDQKSTQSTSQETSLQEVQKLVGGFISEYRNVISKLENQYEENIKLRERLLSNKDNEVKDKNEVITEKDKEISELKKQLDKKKGFFKKVFGG